MDYYEAGANMKGFLTKESGLLFKSWQRRWCVLIGSSLFYYKDQTGSEGRGEIILPSLSAPLALEAGLMQISYDAVHRVFTLSPSTLKWGESHMTVAGDMTGRTGADGQPEWHCGQRGNPHGAAPSGRRRPDHDRRCGFSVPGG